MTRLKLTLLTVCVLIAFAANSVLGRMALKSSGSELIDPASYTSLRLAFGALVLMIIQQYRKRTREPVRQPTERKSFVAAIALLGYAVCFSFAYIQLDAAAGTLVLFAGVQFTMLVGAALRGELVRGWEILGALIAFGGLAWLLSPSLSQTTLPVEAFFMLTSGVCWGIYSLAGKGSKDPIADTAGNFIKATPLSALLCLVLASRLVVSREGFLLAAVSGAVTSGMGYVLWYSVLPSLTSTQAAVVQLSVPIVAGLGGVIFAGDSLTSRTVIAGVVVLIGISFTIRWKKPKPA